LIIAVLALLYWRPEPDTLPQRLTVPAARPARRRGRRRGRPRNAGRPAAAMAAARRAARPARENIDRAALIAALRGLGHRADEARRMAAAVPADITEVADAITFLYRKV
jgi:hypothetical protein